MLDGVDFGNIFNIILRWFEENIESSFNFQGFIEMMKEYFNLLFGPPTVLP